MGNELGVDANDMRPRNNPGQSSRRHTGHIECHCLHNTNETVEEARTSGRIHLNSACFWSCCRARWDDFECKNRSGEEEEGGRGGEEEDTHDHSTSESPEHEHTGFIACKCGHKRKELWAEARTHALVHNDHCHWSCCGAKWSQANCTGDGTPFDPSQHVHQGHIKCRCCHKKNDTVDSLASSGRTHLHCNCFWSCCGARWDDPICECGLPESLRKSSPDNDNNNPFARRHHRDDSEPKHKRKRKDYSESIMYSFNISKSKIDINY